MLKKASLNFNDRFIINRVSDTSTNISSILENNYDFTQTRNDSNQYNAFLKKTILNNKPITFADISNIDTIILPPKLQNSSHRRIKKEPINVMAVSGIRDDFYSHLLDWSSSDKVGVGLNNSAYVWSPNKSSIHKICQFEESEIVTSVKWNDNSLLSLGTSCGHIYLLDAEKSKIIRVFDGHESRVGCISWNNSILASGSKDKSILLQDIRSKKKYITKFIGHTKEVCTLAWANNKTVLASGGNDSKVIIWSPKDQKKETEFSQHQAAVRALTWDPYKNDVLISGGGTEDKTIKIWNYSTNSLIKSVDTGSQICNLVFNENMGEVISTHGYSKNEICIWKYDTMERIACFPAHMKRVIYSTISPCAKYLLTGAADESIKMWDLTSSSSTELFRENSLLFPKIKDLR